jgi:hypothetical protein
VLLHLYGALAGMMTEGAHVLIFQIDGPALGAMVDVAGNLNTTRRTRGCLVADLVSTFRTFDDGHILVFSFVFYSGV